MSDRVRRFPLPWSIQGNEACLWVQDADGKRIAFIDERPYGISVEAAKRRALADCEILHVR
jgi:hypothetical protein